jgi:release factor glutamine methyltransferase
MTIREALASAQLDAIDVRVLLRHACGVDDAYLISHANDSISEAHGAAFAGYVSRRASGEPVAYIVGTREFFSLEFKVTPAVLIPRPETELLVEVALERTSAGRADRVLDLGTGSGCVAIAIAKHRTRAQVTATDRSASALEVALENARLHATPRVEWLVSDWYAGLEGRRFDLIVANPPYIAAGDGHLSRGDLRAEPRDALAAGADGLEAIRTIVAFARSHLNTGGTLVFEHGYDQATGCRELLGQAGFTEVFARSDLAGIIRVSGGRHS